MQARSLPLSVTKLRRLAWPAAEGRQYVHTLCDSSVKSVALSGYNLAKARADQIRAFRDQRQTSQAVPDYMTRLQRRADALITRGNALKSFGAAAVPFYQSLDEAQKHRFAALSRAMGPRHFHRFAAWHQQRGATEQR